MRSSSCSTGCTTQGRTIVMITHEEDVAEHADRRLVLGDGILHDYHSQAAEAHR